ncbi:MAG: WecB/TagA/CpsF family glycosyltransferase [Anaerolineaceae bacterium]|nr:WecB/TagA/CpsF family glycosyltransferase [Anaerolineaceae bacterium]
MRNRPSPDSSKFMEDDNSVQYADILGVRVHALTMEGTLSIFQNWISEKKPHYVCCIPAHSVMECVDDPALRPAFNTSGLSTPDGMAIVWLLRARGHKKVERVYGPDLLLAACRLGLDPGWRHYFYGSTPEAGLELAAKLKREFPGLRFAGVESPPYRELSGEEKTTFAARIKAARPDILWVGLGSPKQERWMSEWVNTLDIPVMVGVGAAFDFLSGCKPQAPRWMQKIGMEWLYRLLKEPRRLWRRYVLGYPRFIFLVLLEALGIRSYKG